DAVGDDPGRLLQVHEAALRRRPAHLQDGAASPPLRGRRRQGKPGRRAFLDRDDDAGAVRPVDAEAALGSAMSEASGPAQLHLFDLKGRRVLVLGLGDSGVAMARWAARQGANVRVADTRSADGADLPQLQALRAQAGGIAIDYAAGPAWSERWLDDVDVVAWSPGLSIELGESARFHALARERGVPVAGELELFAQALADLRETGYRPKVIAVTGTNGKTTTTALAAHLCRGAGLATVAAGNIRPAMLDALRSAIEADALPQAWVIELSSFQL